MTKEWNAEKKNLLRTMALKIPVLMKDKCTDLKNLNKSQKRKEINLPFGS